MCALSLTKALATHGRFPAMMMVCSLTKTTHACTSCTSKPAYAKHRPCVFLLLPLLGVRGLDAPVADYNVVCRLIFRQVVIMPKIVASRRI